MRKLALLSVFLALPTSLLAGSYTVTTTANQDTLLVAAIPFINTQSCSKAGLPPTCTTAQLQTKFPLEHIYTADTTATGVGQLLQDGLRVSLLSNGIVSDAIELMRRNQHVTFEAALSAATQAQRDSACTAIGLSAGCRQ